MSIAAYTDKTSFASGEGVSVRVSSEYSNVDVNIVNLLSRHTFFYKNVSTKKQTFSEMAFAVGCDWDETFVLDTSDMKPGIYAVKLSAEDVEFYLPIIIRNDEAPADIVVVVNTNTWAAYNFNCGGSFYRYDLKTPNEYTDGGVVASGVSSFSKPNTRISSEIGLFLDNQPSLTTHQFNGETYVWEWLTKHDYDFDFVTDLDLVNKSVLDDRKLIILNCHPEYWSHQMYYNFSECINNTDTSLLYLGGNAIWRKVILNQEENRIEKIGYPWNSVQNSYESKWSKDQFAKENPIQCHPYEILGMFYDIDGYNTYAPFKCINDTHLLIEGTGFKRGDIMGEQYDASQPTQHPQSPIFPSGHETDKVNHKHRTKNISYVNGTLIGKGANGGNGGADIFYHTIGNSKILSCGSITFGRCINDPKITTMITNFIKQT